MGIQDRIRYLRKNIVKLTQQEFSDSLKISRSNMGNIEIGRIAVTDRVISDICEKYNVNQDWLRTGEGEIFVQLPEEDEVAAYVSELLEDDGENQLYTLIKEIMHTYNELSPKSKEVLCEFSGKLIENLKRKED